MRRSSVLALVLPFFRKGKEFECGFLVEEEIKLPVYKGFGLPVRLCSGCQHCFGPPDEFNGGCLEVELELRRGFFGLGGKFFLAHRKKFVSQNWILWGENH